MMKRRFLTLALLVGIMAAPEAKAALVDQVNQAFRSVYGRDPSTAEWAYWASRVQNGEKKTYAALTGAMGYQKANNNTTIGAVAAASTATVSTVPASASFKTGKNEYPSSVNPNFLPDGTLIKQVGSSEVFILVGGKKSWILPELVSDWLGENHYFKQDIVVTLSAEDWARYQQTRSVNSVYAGKVLVAPNGTQYFIDDKLRKREISAAVRTKLQIPAGNLYATSTVHLQEFTTGPKLTGTQYPGGMVLYTGAYHGGQIWRVKEASNGQLEKHLYLSDYLYEADGNPDESLRAPADATLFAKLPRGANIEKYPDGWIVGLNSKVYVVQSGKLRHIATKEILQALGVNTKYILTVYPEFLKRYPVGDPIRAFKTIVADGSVQTVAAKAATNAADELIKVRPAARQMIAKINELYIRIFDKEPTTSANQFWVNFVYNGEVNNEADLIVAMTKAEKTGKNPSLTSRTAVISLDKLKSHWFPYLFYFVHQQEPSEDDKDYWYSRIKSGDRDTIEKLGGTIQWLKETTGQTRR